MPEAIPQPIAAFSGLSRWERRGVVALLGVFVLFGLVVEKRSAFMQRRMTDLDVYLRAAWAVRTGADFYDIMDENDWHYQYPPLFAILMTPLADPPAGADRAGMFPFAASVAIWYVFSLGCLVFAVHALASALEEQFPGGRPPSGCRQWWALRVIPVLACLTPIGHTLMRGQVNLLLLALVSAAIATFLRGRSGRAGLWLAGAICLKVIPAFLLLIPLWRRDGRCLAGCALGLIVGLGAVPMATFGPSRTLEYYREYDEKLLRPGVGAGTNKSRAKELIEMTANDSQSILSVAHNTFYPDRDTRPAHPSAEVRWIHRVAGGLLTALALVAARWRYGSSGTGTVLFVGAMVVTMLMLSPVCHLHYFCLAVPLVMGLTAAAWERRGVARLGWRWTLPLWFYGVANLLPNLPGFELARDLGLATYAALLLWGMGCLVLWNQGKGPARMLAVGQAFQPDVRLESLTYTTSGWKA